MENNIQSRLARLRAAMTANGVNAVIIPQSDPHQSEYLASHWQVRRFLSGFSGSAGWLVVTADKALLWTDSRYFIQASLQLRDTGIELMKEGIPATPSIVDWLVAELPASSVVAIDGLLVSAEWVAQNAPRFTANGLLLMTDFDVIDDIWTDRPALPSCPVIIHDEKYAGESARSKIDLVLANAADARATSVLLSALDEIAWTLNLRSRDVAYNPVMTSFLYLDSAGASTLFVDDAKLTPEVRAHLDAAGVATAPYGSLTGFLAALPADARVLVTPALTAATIVNILGDRAVKAPSPVALRKGCKNAVQIRGIHDAMVRDGVALVGAMMEIERRIAEGRLTELDVADILRDHRSRQALYFDESFGTIAGWGPHGAIVHYEADAESSSLISGDNLLLIDSGAQYLDGTTDITRTIAVGTPSAQQRHDFTLVMKGHIAMATAIFPEGTHGLQLDALARQFLWKEGLSYLHGTGHGVGHFLNVHEGPQKISLIYAPAPLVPGMVTSNEPGLYRTDRWGIRCENLTLVVPAMESEEFGRFYKFETLTLFPFDLRLFDTDIMTDTEIEWVNNYHAMVADRLMPHLDADGRDWLTDKTRPLSR